MNNMDMSETENYRIPKQRQNRKIIIRKYDKDGKVRFVFAFRPPKVV
jgi:hypothetical protein